MTSEVRPEIGVKFLVHFNREGTPEQFDALRESHGNPSVTGPYALRCLMAAGQHAPDPKLTLARHIARLNPDLVNQSSNPVTGIHPLHEACAMGDGRFARMLLESRANPNSLTTSNDTAMNIVILHHQEKQALPLLELLLSYGGTTHLPETLETRVVVLARAKMTQITEALKRGGQDAINDVLHRQEVHMPPELLALVVQFA